MRAVFRILSATVFASAVLLGQSLTSVSGVVTNPSGGVIPGAAVAVENTSTGAQRNATSDAAGRYAFLQLQPGPYRIHARASGFGDVVINDLQLMVNSPATVNIEFAKIGSVAEAVTVSADAAQVNTTDASLGNAVSTRPIVQLPLFARNVVALLALQPGVTYFGGGGENTMNGAVNGGKSDQCRSSAPPPPTPTPTWAGPPARRSRWSPRAAPTKRTAPRTNTTATRRALRTASSITCPAFRSRSC